MMIPIPKILTPVLGAVLAWSVAAAAAAPEGLVVLRSPLSAKETMDRFDDAARARGLTIFARIDHAAGAASASLRLRPTEVLIFGNAQGGTPLMNCAQTVAIDLPLKLLVWQDAVGQVWLGYNDPTWLAARHGADGCTAVGSLSKVMSALAESAVALR